MPKHPYATRNAGAGLRRVARTWIGCEADLERVVESFPPAYRDAAREQIRAAMA